MKKNVLVLGIIGVFILIYSAVFFIVVGEPNDVEVASYAMVMLSAVMLGVVILTALLKNQNTLSCWIGMVYFVTNLVLELLFAGLVEDVKLPLVTGLCLFGVMLIYYLSTLVKEAK